MKRILLYVGALALLLRADRGTDIGSLRPVELVRLTEQKGILVLDTDTGDRGWGVTLEQAITKLKETTPGQIYLDTADYILVEEGLEEHLSQLTGVLKKRTRVAYGANGLDLKEAVSYLRVHLPSGRVIDRRNPAEKLVMEGGKLNLKKIQET